MVQPFYLSHKPDNMNRIYTLTILIICLAITSSIAQTAISITDARSTDANGSLLRLDEVVILEGKALGPNFRPGGQTFLLFNTQEEIGITVFSLDQDLGYSVNDNDNLRVTGRLAEFNGLAEIIPSNIEVLAADGDIVNAQVVSTIDEFSESRLVEIEDVSLVDPSQWSDSGSFNIDLTNGLTTFQVRIDSDTDISGEMAPTGTFNIKGIGGQFDNEAPFDSGYQLFPRKISDISPYNTGGGPVGPQYTTLTMNEIRNNDTDGIPSLLGDLVETSAVVYGVNMRQSGLQFTIIDDNNSGVAIFSAEENFGYEINEGDRITVQGELAFFNGLTQIIPDTIILMSLDNNLVSPRIIETLDESTESSLVNFTPQGVQDADQWLGDGSNFNVNFLNTSGDIVTVRIDSDTDNASIPYPGDQGRSYTGIGGQFDNSPVHDEGYQLLPRYNEDILFILSTSDVYKGQVSIYPNPVVETINAESTIAIESLELYSLDGRFIKRSADSRMNVADIKSGLYLIKVGLDNQYYMQKVVIK